MSEVTLRSMTAQEIETWRLLALDVYTAGVVRTTGQEPERVRAEGARRLDALLAEGHTSTEHRLLRVLTRDDTPIGWLRLGRHPGRTDSAGYVFDVMIDDGFRGRGYGRAAMLAAEHQLLQDGYTCVGLSVFGFNEAARSLYDSLNYKVVSVSMLKSLKSGSPATPPLPKPRQA